VGVLSRVAILAVALVACAWFALGARQARDIAHATAIVSSGSPLTTSQASHADSLLSDAGTLNPDSQVDLLRAQVAFAAGKRGQAFGITRRVTAREPQNLLAWLWFERAAPNLKTFYVGAYHLLILAPAPKGR
jgi:hypothetical protein